MLRRLVFLAVLLLITLPVLCACSSECLHLRTERKAVAPDCSKEGYTLNTCPDCGYEYRSNFVAPVGHHLAMSVIAPSCTVPGYTDYSCLNCDYGYRADYVDRTAHTLSTSVTRPDCNAPGYTDYFCTVCDYSYRTDYVSPTAHTLNATVTQPDCTTPGYTTYVCACGYRYTAEPTEPLGHELTSTLTEPSCNEPGHTDYRCSRCGLAYTADQVAPTGHDFTVKAYGPTTCTQTAYTEYTCNVCDHTYIGDYLFYSDVFEGAYAQATEPLAHGLDVSYHNHQRGEDGSYLPLDFVAIRDAGFDFVILRAGSTPRTVNGKEKGGIDPVFEMNYAAAREAGLDIGVYFYTYSSTVEDTRRDAALVMEWLADKQLEYPVYFDIEDATLATLSRREATELCLTFISALQEHRYFAALYVNNSWLMDELQTDKVTFLLDIWYARYPDLDPFVQGIDQPRHTWNTEKYGDILGMWQYTSVGQIPAVSETTRFDFSYAYKDYPEIIKDLGYNGFGKD